jgi:hypothetical protein
VIAGCTAFVQRLFTAARADVTTTGRRGSNCRQLHLLS